MGSFFGADINISSQNQQENVYHAPYETYAPVNASKKNLAVDYSYAPVFNISSPGASGSSISSKKDANLSGGTSSNSGATDTLGQTATASLGGQSIWMIALIGGIALAGAYLLSKRK
jgi:hypothetical protein